MCFYVHKDYAKPLVANEDITCFKVFERTRPGYFWSMEHFYSIFMGFKFVRGERIDLGHEIVVGSVEYIGEADKPAIIQAFHSYSLINSKKNGYYGINGWDNSVLVKCIIPKGSNYYYDPENEEYVSDAIIIGRSEDIIKENRNF